MQSEVAQPAIELGVVASFRGVLDDGRTEGQGLEVVVFCHLILLQVVVDCGQPVVCCPLICPDA